MSALNINLQIHFNRCKQVENKYSELAEQQIIVGNFITSH